MSASNGISRRSFLTSAAAVTAAATLWPGTAVAAPKRPRAGKLRLVSIGSGGQGGADLAAIASHSDVTVVAVCDVNSKTLEAQSKKYNCKGYRDYRVLFKELAGDFDAAIVGTPDHSHALPVLLALRAGKHVYCEKPLPHNIREARAISEAWKPQRDKVATQMGTQRAANNGKQAALKLLADGIVGKARAVHAWSDRPTAGYAFGHGANRPLGADPVPDHLDWDLWLGGAPWRPYKEGLYTPFQWRAWRDFGTGAVGDMGCHILDTAFFALGLGRPLSVRSQAVDSTAEQCPTSQRCDLVFPGTAQTAADKLPFTWYDGQWPMDFESMGIPADEGKKIAANTCIIVGTDGTFAVDEDGPLWLFRDGKKQDLQVPEMPKINHYHQWVDACLGRTETRTPFDFAANLTESLLLSAIASQFPEQDLQWDGDNMAFPNKPGATTFVGRSYRHGFEIAVG